MKCNIYLYVVCHDKGCICIYTFLLYWLSALTGLIWWLFPWKRHIFYLQFLWQVWWFLTAVWDTFSTRWSSPLLGSHDYACIPFYFPLVCHLLLFPFICISSLAFAVTEEKIVKCEKWYAMNNVFDLQNVHLQWK